MTDIQLRVPHHGYGPALSAVLGVPNRFPTAARPIGAAVVKRSWEAHISKI